MNERADGRIGVPGAGRPGPGSAATGTPGIAAAPMGAPGAVQSAETDRLLEGVQDDLSALDGLEIPDQVKVYDRMHSTLAEALARTADNGGPPAPGEPRA